MDGDDTPAVRAEPGPHPLAAALAAGLAGSGRAARVLLLGVGSGRSIPALLGAGARVEAVEEDADRAAAVTLRFSGDARVRVVRSRYDSAIPFEGGFVAALSTHALLHGTPPAIAATVEGVRDLLAQRGCFFGTLGSRHDPRFGAGRRLGPGTFAPESGSEAGVAHVYYDERGARELFARFALEDLVESRDDTAIGRWAHDEGEAARIVHWWVRARRDQ